MQKQTNVYTKWLVIFPLIGLCGCAGTALRHDSTYISEVYADVINRQLLLNLVRLSHNEPAYFIQLGTINSTYQFNTSAGFAPSHTSIAHPGGVAVGLVQDTLTLGGSLTAEIKESPVFQFIPLNGETFAEAIAAPVSDKVFLTFYDQGHHADLLVRTMVASIKKETKDKSGQTNCEFYVNNPWDPTYPKFLDFCHNLRNAQLNHTLIVDPAKKEEIVIYNEKTMKLDEGVNAIKAGLTVKYDANSTNYVVTKTKPGITLATNSAICDSNVFIDPSAKQKEFDQSLEFAKTYKDEKFQFKLRTFEAIMYAVAKEEVYFKQLAGITNSNFKYIKYDNDPYGAIAVVTLNGETNAFRPIIKIKYGDFERLHLSRLADVKYNWVTYSIGDLERDELDPMYTKFPKDKFPETSNRTVFTLISYLFTQIAIDPEKLPVQQLIQVR